MVVVGSGVVGAVGGFVKLGVSTSMTSSSSGPTFRYPEPESISVSLSSPTLSNSASR